MSIWPQHCHLLLITWSSVRSLMSYNFIIDAFIIAINLIFQSLLRFYEFFGSNGIKKSNYFHSVKLFFYLNRVNVLFNAFENSNSLELKIYSILMQGFDNLIRIERGFRLYDHILMGMRMKFNLHRHNTTYVFQKCFIFGRKRINTVEREEKEFKEVGMQMTPLMNQNVSYSCQRGSGGWTILPAHPLLFPDWYKNSPSY